MTKRDRSGLPKVDNIRLKHVNEVRTAIIEVQLSNGYVTEYDFSSVQSIKSGEGERFSYFIQQCGLMRIDHSDELMGRLYHGDLTGWWWLYKDK